MFITQNAIPLFAIGTSSVLAVVTTYQVFKYVENQNWLISKVINGPISKHMEVELLSRKIEEVSDTTNDDIVPTKISGSFDDVKGCENGKSELEEYVCYFKTPDLFSNIGGAISNGCLLLGPSGTGKSTLARSLAGQAKVLCYDLTYFDGTFCCNRKKLEVKEFFKTIRKIHRVL